MVGAAQAGSRQCIVQRGSHGGGSGHFGEREAGGRAALRRPGARPNGRRDVVGRGGPRAYRDRFG